jgi:hypothetical protein
VVDEGDAQIQSDAPLERAGESSGDCVHARGSRQYSVFGRRADFGLLSMIAGLFSVAWAVAILLPDVRDLPAWPAASVGIFALMFAGGPGRALTRGIGAFLGLIGLIVGAGKILALWGLLELLT